MTSIRRTSSLTAILLCLVLLAAGCGGEDTADTAATEAADTATTEATEAAEDATEEATEEADDASKPDAAPTEEEVTEAPTPTPAPTTEAPATPEPAGDPVTPADAMEDMGGDAAYAEYALITDDTGAIEVEVPVEWAEIDGRPFNDEQGRELFDVRAAPSLERFAGFWDEPGIIITASRDLAQSANEITLLDQIVEPLSEQCDYLGRSPYDDGLYTGMLDIYENCGGTTTGYAVIGAVPDSRAFVIRVQVQVVAERDLEALTRAIDTFRIVGEV